MAMELDAGVNYARTRGVIPEGMIEERIEKDRYENDVSIISMCTGEKYRMVHHSPENKWWRQTATIYGGRGKFVKVEYKETESDLQTNTLTVAGIKFEWGDGDCFFPSNLPEKFTESDRAAIRDICGLPEGFHDLVIIKMMQLVERCDLWQFKDVRPKD